MDALDRAIEIAGSVGKLADLIKSRQSVVSNWRSRGNVSAEGCAEIERATAGAVTCEQLRADLQWHRVIDADWPWHTAGRPVLEVTKVAA